MELEAVYNSVKNFDTEAQRCIPGFRLPEVQDDDLREDRSQVLSTFCVGQFTEKAIIECTEGTVGI